MAKEIERKYLVCGDFEPYAVSSVHICQGYLNPDPDRTVRVRVKGDEAFICVKGRNNGISRFEWEHRIPKEDALSLLPLCGPGVIASVSPSWNSGRRMRPLNCRRGSERK